MPERNISSSACGGLVSWFRCGLRPALAMLLLGATGLGDVSGTERGEGFASQQRDAAVYDAAQRAQTAGDLAVAARDYQGFLAATLRRLAEGHAHTGDYPGAAKLFDQALAVELPESSGSLRLSYAEAALVARDTPKAKSLAQAVLESEPKKCAGAAGAW